MEVQQMHLSLFECGVYGLVQFQLLLLGSTRQDMATPLPCTNGCCFLFGTRLNNSHCSSKDTGMWESCGGGADRAVGQRTLEEAFHVVLLDYKWVTSLFQSEKISKVVVCSHNFVCKTREEDMFMGTSYFSSTLALIIFLKGHLTTTKNHYFWCFQILW